MALCTSCNKKLTLHYLRGRPLSTFKLNHGRKDSYFICQIRKVNVLYHCNFQNRHFSYETIKSLYIIYNTSPSYKHN